MLDTGEYDFSIVTEKLSSGQHYSRELLNLDSLISADIAMHGGRIELKISRPVETQLSHLSNVSFGTIINLPESRFLYPSNGNNNIFS